MRRRLLALALIVAAAVLSFAAARAASKGSGDDCTSCKVVSGENGPCGCLADAVRCLYYSCTCCVAK